MTKINLSAFESAANATLSEHETRTSRESAQEAEKQAEFAREADELNNSFGPLVNALTSLPPGSDGRRFQAAIYHMYPTELVVSYIGEDSRLIPSMPLFGKCKPRRGFAISGEGDNFTVKDMTRMDGIVYSSLYRSPPEDALTFIGGVLPRLAPERTQEMVTAIARAYGETPSSASPSSQQPGIV